MAIISQEEARKKKVKIVGRTEEESEASRTKALEETGRREKAKKKAIDAGATRKEVGIAGATFTEGERAQKALEIQAAEEAQQEEATKQEALSVAEETGVFEDLPEKVELDTPAEGIGRVPIIGAPISAIDQAKVNFLKGTPLNL